MGLLVQFVSVVLVGIAAANICTTGQGYWSFAIADGVTDFYHGGTPLNKNYYCFEGCLNTATAVQNYKIKLAGSGPKTMVERQRTPSDVVSKLSKPTKPDDPNAEFCIDPVLRNDIGAAFNKTTRPDCKGIINTLVLNLNRQGWAYNCVKVDAFTLDSVVADMNFCDYDAIIGNDIFNIRVAMLDMS